MFSDSAESEKARKLAESSASAVTEMSFRFTARCLSSIAVELSGREEKHPIYLVGWPAMTSLLILV